MSRVSVTGLITLTRRSCLEVELLRYGQKVKYVDIIPKAFDRFVAEELPVALHLVCTRNDENSLRALLAFVTVSCLQKPPVKKSGDSRQRIASLLRQTSQVLSRRSCQRIPPPPGPSYDGEAPGGASSTLRGPGSIRPMARLQFILSVILVLISTLFTIPTPSGGVENEANFIRGEYCIPARLSCSKLLFGSQGASGDVDENQ